MAKKVRFETVQELEVLKIKAELAYELYHELCNKLYKKHGEAQIYSEMEPDDQGKAFLRVSLIDNVKKLEAGEAVVGISMVRSLGVKIERLKNQPK